MDQVLIIQVIHGVMVIPCKKIAYTDLQVIHGFMVIPCKKIAYTDLTMNFLLKIYYLSNL
jgi:hypothetical protein